MRSLAFLSYQGLVYFIRVRLIDQQPTKVENDGICTRMSRLPTDRSCRRQTSSASVVAWRNQNLVEVHNAGRMESSMPTLRFYSAGLPGRPSAPDGINNRTVSISEK